MNQTSVTRAVCLAFLFSTPVFATDYVLVTAEKLDSSHWGSAHANSVIKTNNQSQTQLSEILNYVPGAYAAGTGNPGSNGSLYLRGTDSAHTLYMIDGLEMSDPSTSNRTTMLSNISSGSFEQVEVLRGGQSVLYGSNAIGGVVNLLTEPTKEGRTLSAAYGNAKEHLVRFKQNAKAGNWKYHYLIEKKGDEGFSAAHDTSKSHNDLDGYNMMTVHAGAKGDISENQRLEFALRHQYSKQELDFDASSDEAGRETIYKDTYGRVAHTYFGQSLPIELISSFSFADHKRDTEYLGGAYRYKGNLIKLGLQGNYYWDKKNASSVGIEDKREEDRSPSTRLSKKTNDTYALWANHHFENEKFFSSLGVRFEDDEFSTSRTTYRVAPGYYLPWQKLTLRGVLSTAFRAPTLNQLGDQSVWSGSTPVGNPNLKPERSWQWELGLTHELAALTYFENRIKDRMSSAPTTYQNINSGRAKIYGVEGEAHTTRLEGFSFKGTGTYLKAQNLETKKDLPRRPHWTGSAILDYEYTQYLSALEFLYVGERKDSDYTSVQMPSYYLFSLSLKWKKNDFEVWGKIRNLLDRDYQEIDGYNTPGRQFMAGSDWSF